MTNGHVHLTQSQALEWHMYLLIDQLDYNGLFYYIHIIKLYNLSQNDQWSLIKMTNGL